MINLSQTSRAAVLPYANVPIIGFVARHRVKLWWFVALSVVELAIQSVWHPFNHLLLWELSTIKSLLH